MKTVQYLAVVFVLLLFVLGCNDSDDSSSNDTPKNNTGFQLCAGSANAYSDPTGDVIFDFIDMKNMTVFVGDDCIGGKIILLNLPSQLTFNHTALDDNRFEYDWSITFDLDGNSDHSGGDIRLSLYHTKVAGSQEEEKSILSATKKGVFEWIDSTDRELKATFEADVSGDTIRYYVKKSAYDKLSNISNSTKVLFETTHSNGTAGGKDSSP